jgi:hypothetical protein
MVNFVTDIGTLTRIILPGPGPGRNNMITDHRTVGLSRCNHLDRKVSQARDRGY